MLCRDREWLYAQRYPLFFNLIIIKSLQIKIKYMNKQRPLAIPTKTHQNFVSRNLRPFSASQKVHRPQNCGIQEIITTLQKQVNHLKKIWDTQRCLEKSKSRAGISLKPKRYLKRNPSQNNLNEMRSGKVGQKLMGDVFEVRQEYLKSQGRSTNNIIQLYEFYKKNIEKPQKSTRIMASMEMSNTGNSLQCHKQSLLKYSHAQWNKENSKKDMKHSQKPIELNSNHEEREEKQETSKIQQIMANIQGKSPNAKVQKRIEKDKRGDKTSLLATELLHKGCYNMINLASMLNSKKYKLTKSKEQQFERHYHAQPKSNQQNDKYIQNSQLMNQIKRNTHHVVQKQLKTHQTSKQSPDIASTELRHSILPQIYSKNGRNIHQEVHIQSKGAQKSIQLNNYDERAYKMGQERLQQKTESKHSQIKEFTHEQPQYKLRIEDYAQLNESPIMIKNDLFKQSKYYVQPIPKKQSENSLQRLNNIDSISLKSSSRIIDVDSLPFDL